jgi:hypothetical protein
MELLEEFRLFHNLYEDRQKRRFYKVLPDGTEREAVRILDDQIEIRGTELKQFLAIKEAYLVLLFDLRATYHKTLAAQNLSEGEQPTEPITDVVHWHTAGRLDRNERTFERIWGFKLISGFAKELSDCWPYNEDSEDKEETYPDFITGTDSNGKPILQSCSPHQKEYLTPVFFRKEVLSKYYEQPAKFSVEDGYLRCGTLWGTQIDNDHEDCVAVFLGDLGRDLPSAERLYWRSFNIPPFEGMSETSFRRSFLAEFVAPSQPDLRFRDALKRLDAAWSKNWGWNFYLPLQGGDTHCLASLRIPATSEQREFDNQILNLAKVAVDSLNEADMAKGLKPIENEKGIAKLERFFEMRKIPTDLPETLHTIQSLRSAASAHRKGKTYKKIADQLGVSDSGTQAVFSGLLRKLTSDLESLIPMRPL